MAARRTILTGSKVARPVLSSDMHVAHRRVLGLYRAFYRYIPYMLKYFDIPKTEQDCRDKLREYFYRYAELQDIRVIDVLVLKGYMELKEVTHQWQQKGYIMHHWRPSYEPVPTDFLSKFLTGHE